MGTSSWIVWGCGGVQWELPWVGRPGSAFESSWVPQSQLLAGLSETQFTLNVKQVPAERASGQPKPGPTWEPQSLLSVLYYLQKASFLPGGKPEPC